MSIMSTIRAALSRVGSAARGLSNGMATAAKTAAKTDNAAGRDPCEPSEEEKKEREKSLQPVLTFTISEDVAPKEEPFKPEPLPPAPPKPPPLPPKKLAPINKASAAKPPLMRPKPTAQARAAGPTKPTSAAPVSPVPKQSELSKMMDRIESSSYTPLTLPAKGER